MSKVFEVEKLMKELKALHKSFGEDISSDVLDLANYIVTKCTIEDRPTTNHELQAILFILQREALIYAASPIHNGMVEAWKEGPVIPIVHQQFKPQGYIRSYCSRDVEIKGTKYIDVVVSKVKGLRPQELAHEICKTNGAWHVTWTKSNGEIAEIPLYLIRKCG